MAYEQNLLMIVTFIILGISASQAASRGALHKASINAEKYEQWMAKYGRIYPDSKEKERRFVIFKKNVEFVEKFNSEKNATYTLSVNEFSDMTNKEFLRYHAGSKKPTGSSLTTSSLEDYMDEASPSPSGDNIPTSIDWRERGVVTPVKTQDGCGACWAFAAVAAVEGITHIKTGQSVSLSAQQILDCDEGNKDGCTNGDLEAAFQYIKKNGVASEQDYPYLMTDHRTCDANKTAKPAAQITGYVTVPSDRYDLLMKAVSIQPVSVLIDTVGSGFQSYSGGVYSGPCGDDVNHAVTIVGYGTSEFGGDYWLVKNSWGKDWGEDGYMKISRSTKNEDPVEINGQNINTLSLGICGLLKYAYYPTA